jgi:hypothetical protein
LQKCVPVYSGQPGDDGVRQNDRACDDLSLLFFSMFNKKQFVRLVKTIVFPVFSGGLDLPLTFKSAL